MKLTIKTTVALLVALCGLLVAHGLYELEDQRERAEAQLARSQRTLGHLFRPGIARAWRANGEAAAYYLIEYTKQTLGAEEVDSVFNLRWVWLDVPPGHPRAPIAPEVDFGDRGELSVIVGSGGDDKMVSYVPLVLGVDGERPGALEVVGSLATIRASEQRAKRRLLITAAVGVGSVAFLSLVIGAWFVGRPTRRMVATTEKIGAGDLTARVRMRSRDELGQLSAAIDEMAESLARLQERAEREAEARVRAVEQMQHADRLVTVGKLASGMAHELGTPLAVVAGRAKLIATGAVEDDELVRYAESIERQADKMTSIIRQLLDFARRRAVTLTPKDVRGLARQTVELLRTMAEKKRVELRVEEPDEPHLAPVDGGQLQQVLTNLIVNAIHATPEGGEVVVRMDRAACEPPAGSDAIAGDYLRLSVEDSGAGMTPETAARVFEPFFTTKEVGEGTGLGLSVSHGIVTDHGGWIDAVSEPGKGSCFTVHLPLRPKE